MSQFVQIKDERFRISLISSFEVLPDNPFTPNTRILQMTFSGKLIIIPFKNDDKRLWETYELLQKLLATFVQVSGTKFIKPSLVKRYRPVGGMISINCGQYTIKKDQEKHLDYLDKRLEKYEEEQRDEEKIQ